MSDTKEAPLPNVEFNINDFTICPECSSAIEILNINKEENNTIEFRCIKEDKVYQIMQIKEYLKKIDKLKNKKIEEIKDKCQIHINKSYVCYCFDCKCHLCNECLKTRIHINHRKSNIIEIKPREEEIEIIDEMIKDYDKKLEEVTIEKENKTKEYKEKLEKEKRREEKRLKKENKSNENKEKEEMDKSKIKYMEDIEKIRIRYENEIKIRKMEYEEELNDIKNKYKLINEKERIKTGLKIEKIQIKYKNEINKYNFEKTIEDYDKMLRINRMIFNIYKNYNNNYYNSLNINTLLMYYINNKNINDKIKIKLKDKYDEVTNLIKHKSNEDQKLKENKKIKEEEIDEIKKKVS